MLYSFIVIPTFYHTSILKHLMRQHSSLTQENMMICLPKARVYKPFIDVRKCVSRQDSDVVSRYSQYTHDVAKHFTMYSATDRKVGNQFVCMPVSEYITGITKYGKFDLSVLKHTMHTDTQITSQSVLLLCLDAR